MSLMATVEQVERSRELVALVQRRSLMLVPLWAALAIGGVLGTARGGSEYLAPLVYLAGFLVMWWLKVLHRRWYGVIRPSEAQRRRMYFTVLGLIGAFVLMLIVGPRAVPSPVLFALASALAAGVLWDPRRVSLHWLLFAAVLLWLSVVHVLGPVWALEPWVTPLVVGTAGMVPCVVDHALMVRLMRVCRTTSP
jgi:hypothetical protein